LANTLLVSSATNNALSFDKLYRLVAASKELNTMAQSWNWDAIKMFGKDNGMEWEITKSADAPWENGCSEDLILEDFFYLYAIFDEQLV
jgi:hypothetical protein